MPGGSERIGNTETARCFHETRINPSKIVRRRLGCKRKSMSNARTKSFPPFKTSRRSKQLFSETTNYLLLSSFFLFLLFFLTIKRFALNDHFWLYTTLDRKEEDHFFDFHSFLASTNFYLLILLIV